MRFRSIILLIVVCIIMLPQLCLTAPRSEVVNLDTGKWRLWCDTGAEWKNDTLHLPGEFRLSELPVNPPTGGWDSLYQTGTEVTLPSTVEEHFWGKFGKQPYTDDEYYFANGDDKVLNGNYKGVSWWWTSFKAPKDSTDKIALLKFDGVRLRAEVFLNEELVGYDIVGETPFAVDVTGKVRPGEENILAVRITNPGGRMDWADGGTFKWGKYEVPISHAFGGINKGIRLEFKPRVYIDSVFVMNKPDPHSVTVRCTVINTTDKRLGVTVNTGVDGENVSGSKTVKVAPGSSVVDIDLDVPQTELWSIDNPQLYTCRTLIKAGDWTDTNSTTFGFRFLETRGIGRDARFLWNGKRIVLRSAISWGFWGINGLWPNEEMAERDVLSAKEFGLNCLNSHRTITKPITLDKQDRLGLLRYEEPGSGECVLAKDDFTRKYELVKVARMVERDRNHPSLVMYSIQNELGSEFANDAYTADALEMIHRIDPTRPAVLKSGLGPDGQAYYLPYEEHMRKDNGTGYSGWWDNHTVGGPGIYQNGLYKNSDDWSHKSDNKREIVFWGEMLGVGTPDNLQVVRDYYKKTGRKGFDYDDNYEQYTAFDQFLTKRGFRDVFPTVSDLTRSIANKATYFWGRLIENGRISNPVDCLVVSGWESTSIENHSGLVDSHRYIKGDPELVSYYCRPLHLAIKSHRLVLETGEKVTTDFHLVNEVGVMGKAEMKVRVLDPGGKVAVEQSYPVTITGGEVYGELLTAGVVTECYSKPGYYTISATLKQNGRELVDGREQVFVVDNAPLQLTAKGAILDYNGVARSYLKSKGIDLPDYYNDLGKLDFLIVAGQDPGGVHGGTERTDQPIANTEDDVLYQTQVEGNPDDIWAIVTGIPNGRYQVTLKFAELIYDAPGMRVFDMAINGSTVLTNLDIFAEAGGKFKALDKTVEVDVTDHSLRITSPKMDPGLAVLNAFSISGPGCDISVNCQGPQYTAVDGTLWSGNWHPDELPDDLIKRCRNDGTTLVFWTTGTEGAESLMREFDDLGILKFEGQVGRGSASWMGCWSAVREHPLLNGLPVNTALSWEYQGDGSDGFIIDADGIEWIAIYGKDHNRAIGTSLFTLPYGEGEIVVNCLTSPYYALNPRDEGMATPVVRHMLLNAVDYVQTKGSR